LRYQGVRHVADGNDDRVCRNYELSPLNRNRPPPARSIRFSEFHLLAFQSRDSVPAIREDSQGIGEQMENHPFFPRMMDFFTASRHFHPAAPINDGRIGT